MSDKDFTVFSWEIACGGVRKFLVCNIEIFWNFYQVLLFQNDFLIFKAILDNLTLNISFVARELG